MSVIKKARNKVAELGEEKAIEYFQKQINAFPPPPNTFEDLCLISGLQIAIAFIKNEIPGMK